MTINRVFGLKKSNLRFENFITKILTRSYLGYLICHFLQSFYITSLYENGPFILLTIKWHLLYPFGAVFAKFLVHKQWRTCFEILEGTNFQHYENIFQWCFAPKLLGRGQTRPPIELLERMPPLCLLLFLGGIGEYITILKSLFVIFSPENEK